ncbi:hypothetical protein TPHA_0G01920 [Tetrapisispora phaffii CBS 4417]|uniref:C2H2-type domain-containing protein n=1 Tax=Tetrapisispora phaffii (strain ATCC 24235 / CBS 4417 / NBRC 1672 / NRRL Y-8282 / UCD 70-5) TaxID=1071381 RepID=G8BVV0_TETPH|nr:hypothetical protein TPHA_0G01920 [Tetrapisispora phaffii CBS 4417]CCE64028.1 hypothetical protein TPHA_0G01920 [Tetrapisispora phaffii CBS 4417]
MSKFGRRTWDREEYAQLASETSNNSSAITASLSPTQVDDLKQKYTNYDFLLKNSIADLNKKILTTGLSSFKKGKQFGFYCELCDLTFKDNLQYIDHLNHKTHNIKFELLFEEPLVLDLRDNEDIERNEFEIAYNYLIKSFVKRNKKSAHSSVKKKLTKNPIKRS